MAKDALKGLQKDLRDVAKALEKIGADKSELRQASMKAGNNLADEIRKQIMPISQTGRLLGSVRVNKLTAGVAVTIGNRKVPYAAPINFGWLRVGPDHKKMDSSKNVKKGKPNILPKRFMEKSIRNERAKTVMIWIEELEKLTKKYERKANS